METRANYVLVGAFAIAGFLGLLGFLLWFANVELDRQFDYYDIDFSSVSGLSVASEVRFAGLPVGQVVTLGLSPEQDGRVRVRIEVAAGTPVRSNSTATIEAQGVTGVGYVSITPGSPGARLLSDQGGEAVPKIEAGQSALQSLTESGPEILDETLELVRGLRRMLGNENQQRVSTILLNVEQASGELSETLQDISSVTGAVSTFADQMDRFNQSIDGMTGDVAGVMTEAQEALASIRALSEDARGLVTQGTGTAQAAEAYITDRLGPATDQLQSSVAEIETRFAALSARAETLAETFTETGTAATARLNEAQQTLASVDGLIAELSQTSRSVDGAAQRLDGLLAGDTAALIAELRTATTEATEVIRGFGDTTGADLTAIFEDIRSATRSAVQTIDTVGADLSSASGQLDGLAGQASATLEAARSTFAAANETLSAINGTLETGDRALSAAERAFDGADRVINEEALQITAQLRQTLAALETAVGAVSEQIPEITGELRAASRSAAAAFAGLEGAVGDTRPALRDFSATALPQFARLAAEARALIDNLDALTTQLRRDPSRFFLDDRAPEYRR
ncbi:MlaD family protein [Alloyangia pacifica]|uniref:Phospholipid/cholesterol/gamma-HCH transport system substrate-binding protein n=1 Tax=Alloyangia pacifica TaxID=311180 RepID=A0A1I6QZQ3_9RHOB|nr:MlaD family protein [Alloyangia pacifica]SDG08592.1 phospholipid/cholesterol/gamma-HCH transport system substrate-binding protein [Alloyangia pacifica]SFS57957.1 phospholipid/cholesterol/gamma-HCH transport system substrate-binding protein [Alloyangia pacifica]